MFSSDSVLTLWLYMPESSDRLHVVIRLMRMVCPCC